MLMVVELGPQKVLKVVFGDTPLLHFEDFDDEDVEAAKRVFVAVADELTAGEAQQDAGRDRAVALLRKRLLGAARG
jgi:hypothetical protein